MTDETSGLTAADDRFHPPIGADPSWTETAWYGFDLPDRRLSAAIYPLFRPNLGVCSVAVHVWDDTGSTPWQARYSRLLWHVPMPAGELTRLEVEGLRYETLEPLMRYAVSYTDGDYIDLELEYLGHRAPFASGTQVPSGITRISHFDQICDVRGHLVIDGERYEVDTIGHRDRSWYNRPDNRARQSASVSYGDLGRDDQFVLFMPFTALDGPAANRPLGGHLIRDGVIAAVESGTRRVVERVDGRPRRYELSIRDVLGRTLEADGRALNNFAFQTSPPVFAWFSLTEWSTDHGVYYGQDQEAHGAREVRREIYGPA
jgi:hypothetical protein